MSADLTFSSCCGSEYEVGGNPGGLTRYYICTVCGKPCDVQGPTVGVPTTSDEKALAALKRVELRMVTPWNTGIDYGELEATSLQPHIDRIIANIHREGVVQRLMGKLEAYAHLYGTLCGKAGALFNDGHDKCAQEFRTQAQMVQHLMNQTNKQLREEKGWTEGGACGTDKPV